MNAVASDVRILIAGDHEAVRAVVRSFIESEPRWTICGEASSGRAAVRMAIDLKPDVVVLDVSLSGLDGIEAARRIRRSIAAPVVLMTAYDSAEFDRTGGRPRTRTSLSKAESARRLVDAVRDVINTTAVAVVAVPSVYAGAGAHFDAVRLKIDAVRAALYRTTVSTSSPAAAAHAAESPSNGQTRAKLTPREREVLHLLAEGYTNKQVAARLGITTKTAETHRAHIVSKLKLHSVSALVRYAIRTGMIQA